MKTTKKLTAKNAPKYVLHMPNMGYLAAEQEMAWGVNFTHDYEQAEKFAVGFDNPDDKIAYWSARYRRAKNIQMPGLFKLFEAIGLEEVPKFNCTLYTYWKQGCISGFGSFQTAIMQAYKIADDSNRWKLDVAFPEWFVHLTYSITSK